MLTIINLADIDMQKIPSKLRESHCMLVSFILYVLWSSEKLTRHTESNARDHAIWQTNPINPVLQLS